MESRGLLVPRQRCEDAHTFGLQLLSLLATVSTADEFIQAL